MSLTQIQQVNTLIARRRRRQIMLRTNSSAAYFLLGHVAYLAVTGGLLAITIGSPWVIPAMFLYGLGIVHLFAAQHECAHRTAFRTRSMNDVVGWVIGAIIMLPHIYFRWEHTDHHTFTQRSGRDPQLIPQPTTLRTYLYYLSTIPYWLGFVRPFARHLVGIIQPAERRFIPASECWKVIWEARAMLVIYGAAAAVSLTLHTRALLLFWLLPRLIAEPFMRFVRMTEHVGRPIDGEDLLDGSRTCMVAAPLRWLAWNMPYHAEHHLYPSVPFHALPALHDHLKSRPRDITRGYLAAHREILRNVFDLRTRPSKTTRA